MPSPSRAAEQGTPSGRPEPGETGQEKRPGASKNAAPADVRIPLIIFILMVSLAVLFDVLQFFASFLTVVAGIGIVLCWFIAIVATISFGLWFKLLGVDYFGGKQAARKALTAISSVVVELMPLIDDLPAITAGVVLMFLFSRAEDIENGKLKKTMGALRGAGRVLPTVEGRQSSPIEPKGYGQMRADILANARGRRYDEADQPEEEEPENGGPGDGEPVVPNQGSDFDIANDNDVLPADAPYAKQGKAGEDRRAA